MSARPAEKPGRRHRLAGSLAVVLPDLGAELASAEVVQRLRAVARRLPPIHRAGFECRMDDADAQVDLQQGLIAADGEPAALLSFIEGARDRAGSPLPGAWECVAALCREWCDASSPLHDGLAELWLEFDVVDGGACDGQEDIDTPRADLNALRPSVFASLRRGTTNASRALAERVLALLLPTGSLERLLPTLRRCNAACTDGAWLSHVGVMLGREVAGARLHVSALPLRRMERYLGLIEWPGNAAVVREEAGALLEFVDSVVLCLDAAPDLLPSLGLEGFFEQKRGVDPRWRPLLDGLVARGLCAAPKRDAIMRWAGARNPVDPTVPWPEDLVIQGLLAPRQHFGVIERRLSHVKLTVHPRGVGRAKAYFGFGHLWIDSAPREAVVEPRPATEPPTRRSTRGASSLDGPLDEAVEGAVRFLLGARNQAGWWRDFYDLGRDPQMGRRVGGYASDEWVTAYVGAALAQVDHEEARVAARETWELLVARRSAPDGWGYHSQLPPDADSTVWGLRLAQALAIGDCARVRGARRFLAAQTFADGGVPTYRAEDCPRMAEFLHLPGSYDGWCAAHTCVTAGAAALPEADGSRDFLMRAQETDGRWAGHWWADDEYATARAVEALTGSADPRHRLAAERGAAWAAARLSPAGAVHSAAHGGDSVFATALCVTALAVGGGPDATATIARAVRWLLDQQHVDGRFAPSARMPIVRRTTRNGLACPGGAMVYLDLDATFTTATALAALASARPRLRRVAPSPRQKAPHGTP